MDRDKKVHDLAVAAAAVAVYYNKVEIDSIKPTDRIDAISTDIAERYQDCYKIIDKIIKD